MKPHIFDLRTNFFIIYEIRFNVHVVFSAVNQVNQWDKIIMICRQAELYKAAWILFVLKVLL